MTTKRAPSPRFAEPETRPKVQITPDDIQILWYVYRHRLIDAEMLRQLLPYRSSQNLTRRFNTLQKARYLHRVKRPQEWKENPSGSVPLAYALGNEGAKVLEAEGLTIDTVRWRQKNIELRRQSIAHLLETTETMVKFELASRNVGDVSLVHFDQIMAQVAQGRAQRRNVSTVLEAPVDWRGYRRLAGTDPDKLFGLRNPSKPCERQYSYFCLELDRGTETIEPSERKITSHRFFETTSFLKKMIIYAAAFREKAHTAAFGIPSFRVLTVTTSDSRVDAMKTAYHRHLGGTVPAGLFLFTTLDALRSGEGAVFNSWLDARDRRQSLV